MGNGASHMRVEDEFEYFHPVRITDLTIHKLAGPPPKENKCSTEHNCKIESIEVSALQKMLALDEANTKTINATSDAFDAAWDSLLKNAKKMLEALEVQEFKEEREQVAEAFGPEGDTTKKGDAINAYKKVVDATLDQVNRKIAKQKLEDEAKQPPGKK